ncbi:MAG: GPP34 family phosphoprotein [Bacteroidota bacterium]
MAGSVAELFVILAINPEKGRIIISNINFRYSLTGALLMEYHESGEIKIENKRVIASFRKNGDVVHDLVAEKFMNSSGNWRISFWIRRLTNKNRLIFREIINSLVKGKIIRIEEKKFLNIIPYKRYWFIDNSVRTNLIESLRCILLYGKKPGTKEVMLLGLIEASRAYPLLSRERGESKILRKKNTELLKGDIMSSEISQTIKEIQAAIIASITAASVAAHGSH